MVDGGKTEARVCRAVACQLGKIVLYYILQLSVEFRMTFLKVDHIFVTRLHDTHVLYLFVLKLNPLDPSNIYTDHMGRFYHHVNNWQINWEASGLIKL